MEEVKDKKNEHSSPPKSHPTLTLTPVNTNFDLINTGPIIQLNSEDKQGAFMMNMSNMANIREVKKRRIEELDENKFYSINQDLHKKLLNQLLLHINRHATLGKSSLALQLDKKYNYIELNKFMDFCYKCEKLNGFALNQNRVNDVNYIYIYWDSEYNDIARLTEIPGQQLYNLDIYYKTVFLSRLFHLKNNLNISSNPIIDNYFNIQKDILNLIKNVCQDKNKLFYDFEYEIAGVENGTAKEIQKSNALLLLELIKIDLNFQNLTGQYKKNNIIEFVYWGLADII